MQSFFFWLSVAAGLGALLGGALRPGFGEIIIVLAVLNGQQVNGSILFPHTPDM